MLIGLVKKNGIMMIDFAIEARRAAPGRRRAIHEACMVRFRPITMTTMAALVGTLPIALGWGAGAEAPAARTGSRRRPAGVADADSLHHAGVLHLHGRVARVARGATPDETGGAAHPARATRRQVAGVLFLGNLGVRDVHVRQRRRTASLASTTWSTGASRSAWGCCIGQRGLDLFE